MDLTIIVVSYNTRNLLDECLQSIYARGCDLAFEVLVVDNASTDGSAEMVHLNHPQVRLIENAENMGFGRANNLAASQARGRHLLLLNSDAFLLEDTPGHLVRFLDEHAQAGAVGPLILGTDGRPQSKTFGNLPTARTLANHRLLLSRVFPRSRFFAGIYTERPWDRVMEVGWVSGVCLAVRRAAFEQVGGFDSRYFMYVEDLDLCRRLQDAGWKVYRLQDYAVKHHGQASAASEKDHLRHRIMQQRHLIAMQRESSGPVARLLSHLTLAAGLMVRLVVGLPGAALGSRSCRLRAKASAYCLADLVGILPPEAGEPCANRN